MKVVVDEREPEVLASFLSLWPEIKASIDDVLHTFGNTKSLMRLARAMYDLERGKVEVFE